MKKLIFLFTILIAFTCYADESHKFYIYDDTDLDADGSNITMNNYILAASGSETTVLDFDTKRPQGFASLQMRISGSGTLRIFHESSADGQEWAVANGFSDIVTALTAGSAYYPFDLPFGRYLRLNFVETVGSNRVIIENAVLTIQ